MNFKNFIGYLKNDGFKIVAFSFILYMISSLIGALTPGGGTSSNSGAHFSTVTFLTGIVSIVIALVAMAGAIGSFDELLNENAITLKAFINNGRKYFLRTLGYGIVYCLLVAIIALIPSGIFYELTKNLIGSANGSTVINIVEGIAVQVFAMPYIVLNVLGKDTKGYIKRNYKLLLMVGIIAILITYIPVVGRYAIALINCIYNLLIIMLHEDYFQKEPKQPLIKEA